MERGRRPVHGGHAVPVERLQQKQRQREEFFLQNHARRAELQRLVQILAGGVKVKRRLIAEDLVLGIAAEVRQPVGKIQNGAVGDDDALRRAGRAGGEEQVHGIQINDLLAPGLQKRIVRGGLLRLLQTHERRAVRKPLRLRAARFREDDRAGVHLRENAAHPRLRHLLVDGNVIIPTLQNALQRRDALHCPPREHGHGRVFAARKPGQNGSQRPRTRQQLPEGQTAGGVGKGDLVRDAGGGALQIFSGVCHRHGRILLQLGFTHF